MKRISKIQKALGDRLIYKKTYTVDCSRRVDSRGYYEATYYGIKNTDYKVVVKESGNVYYKLLLDKKCIIFESTQNRFIDELKRNKIV